MQRKYTCKGCKRRKTKDDDFMLTQTGLCNKCVKELIMRHEPKEVRK